MSSPASRAQRPPIGLRPELTTRIAIESRPHRFNAGHSAVVWLENTQARLVEFDLFILDYSQASRRFIEERYPSRVTFHLGPSRETLPLYSQRVSAGTAAPCDLWLIDGDHGKNVELDLFNALAASHAGTIIVADDCGLLFPYVRRFWRVHVGVGSILESGCLSTKVKGSAVEKTWCYGEVAGWAAAAAAGSGAANLHGLIDAAKARNREDRNQAYFQARQRSRGRSSNSSNAIIHRKHHGHDASSSDSRWIRGSAFARARRAARGGWR